MNIKQLRDITIIDLDDNRYLGISCDSCGGIGEKEHDTVKASTVLVGEQTAKVVLAELLSMGFKPLVLSDGLAVEMNDTGKKIIQGFSNTINLLRHNNIHMTGSTEENIKTVQTSIGTTGIGIVDKNNLKYKKTKSNDICILIGLPLLGYDVVNNPDKVMSIKDFEILSMSEFVHEMIPIGSKGTSYEISVMCDCNDLKFIKKDDLDFDFKKSGGPSCSCIVSCAKENIEIIRNLVTKPSMVLGWFE